jgi:thiol:disulfide interchange protein DsbD
LRKNHVPILLALLVLVSGTASSLDFGLEPPGGGSAGSPSILAAPEASPLKAALIPESHRLVPGRPFRVLLELDHRPGTYSYWRNPGGPGLAPRLSWRLPEGFSASGPEWPPPEEYVNSGIVSHAVKGRAWLVYTLTPPSGLNPGARIRLAGELEIQVCTARSCLPLRLDVEAHVQAAEAGAAAAPPDSRVARALARLPAPAGDWRPEIQTAAGGWELTLFPAGPESAAPAGAHFFEDGENGFQVDSQKPQSLALRDGYWRLSLPRLEERRERGAATGRELSGVLRLSGGRDRLPGEALSVRLPFPAPGAGLSRGGGFFEERGFSALALFAFLGGLLLNVMPCVFPVIGLKILGFARQAHNDRRQILLHGLAYAAGVLLCFWVLAALVTGLDRGWGAHLQSPWLLFPLCHLFVILSMNLAGAFRTGSAAFGVRAEAAEGWRRSFLSGLLATLASTPCSAPFLGVSLAYALSVPPLQAFLLFTLMGLGFASPYVGLAAFPSLLKKLPAPGPWMEGLRQAMSFPLFAAAAYLAWTLEAMLEEWRFLALLIGLVFTAMASWLYGRSQDSRPRSRRQSRVLLALALASLALGVWMGLPGSERDLDWGRWSPEEVTRLRNEGRPVYVDFTARWCATCQVNKRVWLDQDLRDLAEAKGVALLQADWTLYDERITSTLRHEFARAAVPVNVVYPPGGGPGKLMPEILTIAGLREEFSAFPDR